MEITENPLIIRDAARGLSRSFPAALDAPSLRVPTLGAVPLSPAASSAWHPFPATAPADSIYWQDEGPTPEGVEGYWYIDGLAAASGVESPPLEFSASMRGASLAASAYVQGFAGSTAASTIRTGIEITEFSAAGTALKTTRRYLDVEDAGAWQEHRVEFGITSDETRRVRVRVYMATSSGGNQGKFMFAAGLKVETLGQPYGARWGAAAARDGHLEGLWTLPPMIGEIKDNPVHGGGLAPGNPQIGVRAISYFLYLTAASVADVRLELKDLTGFMSGGNLTVDNHGHGWTYGGYLAAPPAVEWLAYDYPAALVSFTLSFLDPIVWPTNWAEPETLGAFFTGVTPISTAEVYYSGRIDCSEMTREDKKTVTIENRGATPTWPLIGVWFGPSGPVSDRRTTVSITTLSSARAGRWKNDGAMLLSNPWDPIPGDEIRYPGFTSWFIDTHRAQAYGGITHEDGYLFEPLYYENATFNGTFEIPPGGSMTLTFEGLDGVGDIAVGTWFGNY